MKKLLSSKFIVKVLLSTVIILPGISCEESTSYTEYLFPENFRVGKIEHYTDEKSEEPGMFTTFEYDENWNMIKKSELNHQHSLIVYYEYEYSDNLLIEERTFYDQGGQMEQYFTVKYEYSDGKLTGEMHYRNNGTLIYSVHNEYDGDNLISKYWIGDTEGLYQKHNYTYNEANLLLLDEFYEYYQLSGFTRYTYDDNKRLVKTEDFEPGGTRTVTEIINYTGSGDAPAERLFYNKDSTLSRRVSLIYDRLDNPLKEIVYLNSGIQLPLYKKKYKGKLLTEHINYMLLTGPPYTVARYKYINIRE